MSPLIKIMIKPMISAILALLEKIEGQIQNNQTADALSSIRDLKKAVESAREFFKL